ncbi:MAG: hypothetical protein KJ950_06885 [Proteobacteria bacterium]|nr:hypothetical protein [Pseudomonadota bacterium]MBU1686766.1 hypothetical protein [Pseudomonadota bacterium]
MAEHSSKEAEIIYKHGTYRGDLEQGLPHGMGIYSCVQYTYKGFWTHGSMNGIGEMTEADGAVYKGGFRADRKHGRGTFKHPNGVRYEGFWEDNLRHGHGTLFLPDGTRKEGLWIEDRYIGGAGDDFENSIDLIVGFEEHRFYQMNSGKDVVPFQNGTYSGDLRDGNPHGRGTYHGEDYIYDGMWKNGVMEGHGTLVERDGAVYEGEWRGGKRYGQGIEMTQFIGGKTRYEGAWSENKRHGRGILRYSNGMIYDGEWLDGKKQGWGVEVSKVLGINTRFEGAWENDQKNGRGIERSFFEGIEIRYEGEWKDNRKIGVGVETTEDHVLMNTQGQSSLAKRKKIKVYSRFTGKK